MSTIRCVNAKSYKLTVGKDYNVEKETSDYFYVINDGDTTSKYVKELFTRGPGRPTVRPTIPTPVTPPTPPRRTSRDVITSIRPDGSQIVFEDINNRRMTLANNFRYNSSNISCGVNEISGIDSLISRVNGCFGNDDDYLAEKKALLQLALNHFLKAKTNVAMFTASTAIRDEDEEYHDEDTISWIDEIADVSTEERKNPNSGNMIKTWIFYTNV